MGAWKNVRPSISMWEFVELLSVPRLGVGEALKVTSED